MACAERLPNPSYWRMLGGMKPHNCLRRVPRIGSSVGVTSQRIRSVSTHKTVMHKAGVHQNTTLTCDRASVTFWTWESPRQCTRERMHICTPRTAVLWGVCSRCGNSKINHLSFLIYQHHHSLPYVLSLPLALTLATLKFILFTTRKIA